MILRIDIFSRAYMSYGKVLLVTASCTQCYDDSDEITTIMEGEVCTSGTHNRFTWLGLIIHSGVDIRRDDQCFNLLLWCYHFDFRREHVYSMGLCIMWKITGMHLGKWRCWYLVIPKLSTAQNCRVMCTSGTHNKVTWSGLIMNFWRWLVFYLVSSVLPCSSAFFERHSMRLFASLQRLGGSGLMKMIVSLGKLPKLHLEEAKFRRFGGA